MKINEVLNKVTLKLPGGGKFPLSKYAPYITNVDEDVEGLSGNSEPMEFKYTPAAYLAFMNWFESEDKAWEYRYRTENNGENYNDVLNEIYSLQEPILVTEQDVKNQINILNKVFGYNWKNPSTNSDDFGIVLYCLYKENNIQLGENLIGMKQINQNQNQSLIYSMYTFIPYLMTEEINQQMINDGNSEFSEGFIQNLNNQGLYIYTSLDQVHNYIDPNTIPNISEIEEMMFNTPEIPQEWIDAHASEFEAPMS